MTPAEASERFLVPAIFAPRADAVLRAHLPARGNRVLDVACGTGIGARLAAAMVGPTGLIAGLDSAEGMLSIARATGVSIEDAPIEWHLASALKMPFLDNEFDYLLCLEVIQFFPDRSAGLREMRRVLRSGGRLVASVWSPMEQNPAYHALAEGLRLSWPTTSPGVRGMPTLSSLNFPGPDVCGARAPIFPHVFHRFRGVDRRSVGTQGLLVLAIVRENVEMHGGTVEAQSDGPGPHDTRMTIDPPITELARLRHALLAAGRLIRERGASLERQVAELRVARETAEAGNRAKDEFLALLSHELRTPLNAVYGWARMLREGQIGADALPRALDAIVRNANAQLQLIDDLLDVSRVIAGKMRLDVRSVDLKAVVEDALDAVRPAAEGKSIRLQSILDPRAGPITGDPARLQQVVWNLLMNAVKFTEKGGRVQVHLQRINSHVEIVVSDTGRGIDPDLLPLIFDRFRQADSSSTRAHGGLGLGLALVKHLVEMHGGTVVAQSGGDDKGATFIVKLPLRIAAIGDGPGPRVHPTAPVMESISAGVRLDDLRVLVVDDDPDAVELATAILAGAGAVVRTCGSAREAFVTVQEWRPDVLVSDIEMPGEDGYALIRKVRALDAERGGKTPAVALTAYGRTQDRMLSLTAGYSMHVPKPVDPREFTTIIASVAGRPPE